MRQRFSVCGEGTPLNDSAHCAFSRDGVPAAHRTIYLAKGLLARRPKQLAPQAEKSLGSTFCVVTRRRDTPAPLANSTHVKE